MITPHSLTCQRVKTPMGIAAGPTFSWKLRSEERNQTQSAYRIQAASSPDKICQPDIYDSQKVLSDQTLDIPWDIAPLPPFTRVCWSVTVWDQDDHAATSETTWFETGVTPQMWNGKTIFAGDTPDQPYEKTSFATTAPALDMPVMPFTPEAEAMMHSDAPPPDHELPKVMRGKKEKRENYFRKEFSCKESISRARLYLTASGPCLVRLNGKPAGAWLHDPSPNACSYRSLYTPYDISDGLNPGTNTLAISSAGKNIAVILMVEYADGTRELLSTDTSWRWISGPTILTGSTETYDSRNELPGWDENGYDDSLWAFCGIGPDPLIDIYPNLMPVQKVVWSEHPKNLQQTPWGTWRCKASIISAGHVRLRLGAPAGTEIKIHMAEKELQKGQILRGTDPIGNEEEGGSDTFTYIFKGEGIEEWAPRYSYAGIGWLEIEGYPGTIQPEDITYEAVLNAAEHISTMTSSEPMFTQLHEMLIRTIENNFHGVLTTCPPYEKGPADGDTSVTLPAFLWNLDCLPIVKRLDDDFAATIRFRRSYSVDDLNNNLVAPGMIRTVPEWSSMLVHNCMNLYNFNGYLAETTDFYGELQRYFRNELAELEYSDYIVDSFFGGDWNSPQGNGAPEGGILSGTCYEYYSHTIMARLSELIGKPKYANYYNSIAARIKESINEKCLTDEGYQTAKTFYHPAWGPPPWDGKGQPPLPVGFRQTSNLLPIAFKIVPEDKKQEIVTGLVDAIHKNGDHLAAGFVGCKYLLTTLSDLGYLELAYTIATQRSYPSWGYWMDQGATTCWEQWGTFSRSYDHYFLAAGPEDWFRETLAGIRDQQDGFKTFTIRPQIPEKLRHFSMASDTARGTVSSAWEKTPEGLKLTIQIPVGSTATVIPPCKSGQHICLDGKETSKTTFTLGSGTYEFIMRG